MIDQPRAILHIDLDAFFAAVEILENPALAGLPVLVGGRPSERGVVAAASYPARAFGCRSAMPMGQALKLCPQAIVLPVRHSLYRQYSRRVMALLHALTALVEQVSIDEAFLELTGQIAAWEELIEIARRLQGQVREEIGLSASLGVATNKQVAKVASDFDKPGGLTVVRPGQEAAFLAPLPARALWGVGPVTAARLAGMGVHTVAELASLPDAALAAAFGRHGPELGSRARGVDDSPVVAEHVRKSISQERTFDRDIAELRPLKQHLWRMSQAVAGYLRGRELAGGVVAIKLRYSDFTTLTRQMTLPQPSDDAVEIYRAALTLLERAWEVGRPVRLLGVGAHQLSQPSRQLSLFDDQAGVASGKRDGNQT
jgi:DNA polymerase-4